MPNQQEESINMIRQQAYELLTGREYGRARELFEQVYDGKEAAIASCLGFIHDQRESSEYNVGKAIEYYAVAAEQGDVYAQYALGGLLKEQGQIDEAIKWYAKASELGNAECSYALYLLLMRQENDKTADRSLELAAAQGHPVAIQRYAVGCILGRFGIGRIAAGLFAYFRNMPNLIRYTKEHVTK